KGVFKEFNDAFNGASVGETKQFKVTYPPDHQPEHLAGKTVEYSAEVTGILTKELPDLDDQFAQSVNEDFKTVAELRNSVREDLEHKVEHQTDEEVRNAVMEQLIERNRFEVPQVAVEETMNARMKTLVRGLAAQGVDPKTLKIDWSALREQDRERATKEVR